MRNGLLQYAFFVLQALQVWTSAVEVGSTLGATVLFLIQSTSTVAPFFFGAIAVHKKTPAPSPQQAACYEQALS